MINFQVISGENSVAGAGKAAGYVQDKLTSHKSRETGTEYTTGYYSAGGAPSQWLGSGAKTQGLAGTVETGDLIKAMLGQIVDGPDISSRGGKTADADRRYAMDLTLSAPKSVSMMALAGGDERLLAAHDAAVAAAMAYVQDHMVYARIGKGGAESEFTGSMTAASFRHETSRTVGGVADPQLHTHTLILNETQRADGTWTSARLDFGHNNEKFNALDSIYKAELAKHVRAAGYDLEHTADGFEIKGITRQQIEVFSARKTQIDNALKEQGLSRETASAQQRDNANTATRESKSQLSDIDQKYEWRERARAENIDFDAMREVAELKAASGKGQPALTGEDAIKSALHHLGERDTLITETALMDEALKAGLGHVTRDDVGKAIADKAGGLLKAGVQDRGEGKTEQMYTTETALLREAEILQRATDGHGQVEAIIDVSEPIQRVVPDDVSFTEEEIEDGKREYSNRNGGNAGIPGDQIGSFEEAEPLSQHGMRSLSECSLDANPVGEDSGVLQADAGVDGHGPADMRWAVDDSRVAQVIDSFEKRKGFKLGDGQKAAVALALTTTDRHIGIVGAAGAGKTTAMELLVDEYRKAGYEIVGVAPSAAASRELQSAGCDDTRTLASALMMKQKEEDIGKKKLFIMDESGMVSAKDMDDFLKKADAEGARSILVGDPLQLASVEAGSAYKQLLESTLKHVKIDEIQRQTDLQLRAIAQAFARGDAEQGVTLAKPYMVTVKPTEADFEAVGVQEAAEAADKKQPDDADKKAPLAPKAVRAEALARAAAEAYLRMTPEERNETLMMAATNATRQAINVKVRDGLKEEGTLGAAEAKTVALDKMSTMTREGLTRAENYVTKKEDTRVMVRFDKDFVDPNDVKNEAKKGQQFYVTDTSGGKLTLQSFDNPERQIVVDPAKARLSAYETREMGLSVGDQVIFRQNDKDRNLINGMMGQVVGVDAKTGTATVKLTEGHTVEINPKRAEVMDYSYARTIHSAQGATFERAIVVGEGGKRAMAELAYVACSREKSGLVIITDDPEKLSAAWSKFAEKEYAKAATGKATPENIDEIVMDRFLAKIEAGEIGDLAIKRAADVQIAQEPEQEPEPVPEPEPEKDLEIER
ncbi:MobF family relaxase [Acidithiobacillus ferrooxidans]|uniref:MobF family relaxase n=1 Tax=Acidithiobacillus ferrooxidans TaxID=920 RepID=UPI000A48B1A1|nr:MobF family relaxase [Acidithiobacillus ferrooxidans]